MSLDLKKANYINFGKKKHKTKDIEILLDEHDAEQVLFIKFMGIILDENLGWVKHVIHRGRKITSALFTLRSTRSYSGIAHSLNIRDITILYSCLSSYLR